MVHQANGPIVACADLALDATEATVALAASDATSGLASLQYSLDGGPLTAYTAPVRVTGAGSHTVTYRAADLAGNVREGSVPVVLRAPADTVKPTVTTSVTPATADGKAGWYVKPVTVSATAADDKPGVSLAYSLDGGAYAPYTAALAVDEGTHVLAFRATDAAGNVSDVATVTVKRDATAPTTAAAFAPGNDAGWANGDVPVTLTGTDAASGVASTEYSLDGAAYKPYTGTITVRGDGIHTLKYRSTDTAGNAEAERATTLKIDGTKPTLLVEGIVNGQVYGDSTDLKISWSAADVTSGVKVDGGTLDGKSIDNGRLLSLFELTLGVHELVVTATDHAGNVSSVKVSFAVNTSFVDVQSLLDRFLATKRMDRTQHKALTAQLERASKPAGQRKNAQAIKELQEFKALVARQTVAADVKSVLTRDADALIVQLGGKV
jgi:hypothetical protein